MQFPTGSVVALSSAAATMFSMGMLFLGYWGWHEPLPWRFGDYVVILPALAGFACLVSVPFLATSPMKTPDDESRMFVARRVSVRRECVVVCDRRVAGRVRFVQDSHAPRSAGAVLNGCVETSSTRA